MATEEDWIIERHFGDGTWAVSALAYSPTTLAKCIDIVRDSKLLLVNEYCNAYRIRNKKTNVVLPVDLL